MAQSDISQVARRNKVYTFDAYMFEDINYIHIKKISSALSFQNKRIIRKSVQISRENLYIIALSIFNKV